MLKFFALFIFNSFPNQCLNNDLWKLSKYSDKGIRLDFFNEMQLKYCLHFAFVNNNSQIRYQPNPTL